MIKEITAKVLLSHLKQPDHWFGLKYNMNLYRGCQHQCIYCDSRSECYQIENFSDILVKKNALDLLDRELAGKRVKSTIGTGSMNDPYMPVEKEICLTKGALEIIAQHRFPIHILTKSSLVLRDIELIKKISRVYAAVSFSIITIDDNLGRILEPGASLVSERFQAIAELAKHGIYTGILLMPVLPFLCDTAENINSIVVAAKAAGAQYIIASLGMTLRDRQRSYYYQQLDHFFPGVRARYEQQYGDSYYCESTNVKKIWDMLQKKCAKNAISLKIAPYVPPRESQLELF